VRRVAVENLGDLSNATLGTKMCRKCSEHRHHFFDRRIGSFDCLDRICVDPEKPGPNRSLMIGPVALCLPPSVEGPVRRVVRREGSQADWREELLAHGLKGPLLSFLVDRDARQTESPKLVGSQLPVRMVAIVRVSQEALILKPELFFEVIGEFLRGFAPLFDELRPKLLRPAERGPEAGEP